MLATTRGKLFQYTFTCAASFDAFVCPGVRGVMDITWAPSSWTTQINYPKLGFVLKELLIIRTLISHILSLPLSERPLIN